MKKRRRKSPNDDNLYLTKIRALAHAGQTSLLLSFREPLKKGRTLAKRTSKFVSHGVTQILAFTFERSVGTHFVF